jgi:hypothetical protein
MMSDTHEPLLPNPNKPRTAYDEHMDALAVKISQAVQGEINFDVASACCAIAAYALRNGIPDSDDRAIAVEKLIELMRKIIEYDDSAPSEPTTGSAPSHTSEPKLERAPKDGSEMQEPYHERGDE